MGQRDIIVFRCDPLGVPNLVFFSFTLSFLPSFGLWLGLDFRFLARLDLVGLIRRCLGPQLSDPSVDLFGIDFRPTFESSSSNDLHGNCVVKFGQSRQRLVRVLALVASCASHVCGRIPADRFVGLGILRCVLHGP